MSLLLDLQEQQLALKLAKDSLSHYLNDHRTPHPISSDITDSKALSQQLGAFVTLKQNNQLRGCIGCIQSTDLLYNTISNYAIQSAINDHRFSAVTLDELESLSFECSVLSAPSLVSSYNDIEIGRHGIILEKNNRSALFLPKVATEQQWDLALTLSQLCLKAGLNADSWKQDCKFQVFTAQEF